MNIDLYYFKRYLYREMPTMNLEKIYTSPYRSFNFQLLFFYDIFCATRILRVIGRQSIRLYDSIIDRHKIQDSGHSNK